MSPARVRRAVLDVLAVVLPTAAVLLTGQRGQWFPVVAGLVACAALVFRHWWPRLVVLACLPAVAGGLGWAPVVVALVRLGRARASAWLVGWVLLVAGTALAPVLIMQRLPLPDVLVTVAFALLAAGSPAAIGGLVAMRQQLATSLQRLREATEAESFAKAETARAEERARIAREIHDAVGHHVTLIAVEAAALATMSQDPAVRESANRLRGLAKEAMGEVRSTLGLVADQRGAAGAEAIPGLVERAREAGLQVELCDAVPETVRLPPGVGRALYRGVQEALTNVSKHAPGTRVVVRLGVEDGMVRAEVRNDAPVPGSAGPSVDVGSGGTGLAGLAERVRMLGGSVDAAPAPGGGYALRLALPLANS